MAQSQVEQLEKDLQNEGFGSDEAKKIGRVAAPYVLPPATYNKAVLFLGWATIALAVGSIGLAAGGREIPDALWGALGGGIGGLAGIFMGKD